MVLRLTTPMPASVTAVGGAEIVKDMISKVREANRRYRGETWSITSVRCAKTKPPQQSFDPHVVFPDPITLRVQIKKNGKVMASSRVWFWKRDESKAFIKFDGNMNWLINDYKTCLWRLNSWFENHLDWKGNSGSSTR